MSVELLEMIKQRIAALSPQEKSELVRYLQEQAKQDAPSSTPSPDDDAAEIMRQRRMAWLKANREKYGGQYVALDGDQLVSTGRTFREVMEAARAAGKPHVFATYLSKPDEVAEWGGWL